MKKQKIEINYLEYNSIEELTEQEQRLLKAANEAMLDAYAPYSKFYVGAAVLLTNKKIVKGNNQENVSYPAGLCAERVALFSASANYPNEEIVAIAICASSEIFEINQIVSPCGSCRQVMAEYERKANKSMRILLGSKSGKVLVFESVENLLPLMFFEEKLKAKNN